MALQPFKRSKYALKPSHLRVNSMCICDSRTSHHSAHSSRRIHHGGLIIRLIHHPANSSPGEFITGQTQKAMLANYLSHGSHNLAVTLQIFFSSLHSEFKEILQSAEIVFLISSHIPNRLIILLILINTLSKAKLLSKQKSNICHRSL